MEKDHREDIHIDKSGDSLFSISMAPSYRKSSNDGRLVGIFEDDANKRKSNFFTPFLNLQTIHALEHILVQMRGSRNRATTLSEQSIVRHPLPVPGYRPIRLIRLPSTEIILGAI